MAPQPQSAPFGMPCLWDPVCRTPASPQPRPVMAPSTARGGVLAELADYRREA